MTFFREFIQNLLQNFPQTCFTHRLFYFNLPSSSSQTSYMIHSLCFQWPWAVCRLPLHHLRFSPGLNCWNFNKVGLFLVVCFAFPPLIFCADAHDWYSSSLKLLLYAAYTVFSCALLLWHQFLSIRSVKFLIFTFLSVFKHNFKVLVYGGIFSFGWLSPTLLFAYRCIYWSLSKRKLTIRNKYTTKMLLSLFP